MKSSLAYKISPILREGLHQTTIQRPEHQQDAEQHSYRDVPALQNAIAGCHESLLFLVVLEND
jgi:hypothetical protein